MITTRLLLILAELEQQQEMALHYSPDQLSHADEMSQLREYLDHNEFVLSNKAGIALLEVGLLMGFKTDQHEDAEFDTQK